MADKKSNTQKRSGFDVDIPFANPHVYPKGTKIKRNPDGTIEHVEPKRQQKKSTKK